jgi:uncharacterized protein (TIGR02265 family)
VPEAEFKSAGLISMLRTLREMVGAPVYDELVAALPPDTRELVRQPPLAMSWIPNHHFDVVVERALAGPFGGDVKKVTDLAQRAMLGDLNSVYRVFIRMLSPEFVLRRAAKIYAQYTRYNGTFTVGKTGPGFAELTIDGVSDPTPAVWAYNEGAIRAVITATGLKEAQVAIIEGGGTSNRCVFRGSWK